MDNFSVRQAETYFSLLFRLTNYEIMCGFSAFQLRPWLCPTCFKKVALISYQMTTHDMKFFFLVVVTKFRQLDIHSNGSFFEKILCQNPLGG